VGMTQHGAAAECLQRSLLLQASARICGQAGAGRGSSKACRPRACSERSSGAAHVYWNVRYLWVPPQGSPKSPSWTLPFVAGTVQLGWPRHAPATTLQGGVDAGGAGGCESAALHAMQSSGVAATATAHAPVCLA
jgi:hypothetical protein